MLNDLINKIDKQFTLLDYVIIDETQWKRIKKLIKDAQKIKESDELRAALDDQVCPDCKSDHIQFKCETCGYGWCD